MKPFDELLIVAGVPVRRSTEQGEPFVLILEPSVRGLAGSDEERGCLSRTCRSVQKDSLVAGDELLSNEPGRHCA